MTAFICIANCNCVFDNFEGASLPLAAEAALAARGITVTATTVRPIGGTHYHSVDRYTDPDAFWSAQMGWAMGDDENWGHGQSAEEARSMAQPGCAE